MNMKLMTAVLLICVALVFVPSIHGAVTIVGDINGDGKVDIFDVIALGRSFGTTLSNPNFNPNADLNADGTVDLFDAALLAANFGM